jgi:hypothetical protein
MRNDPQRAAEIADEELVIKPVYANDPEMISFGASERLQMCAIRLSGEGLNIASLSGEQWRERIERMGITDPDEINALFEELTSWAQTDDNPDEAPSLELPLAAEESRRTK